MLVRLRVIRGKANKEAVVVSLPAVIGRSRDADLTVIHPMISRRHCELFEQDGSVKVRDLGSLNGTYVAGEQVQECVLPQGAVLTVGPLVFRVEYDMSPAANRQDLSALRGQTVRVCMPDIMAPGHPADSDSPSRPIGILPLGDNMPSAGEPATEPAKSSHPPQSSVCDQEHLDFAGGIAPSDGALPNFSSLPPVAAGQGDLESGEAGTSGPHSQLEKEADSSASGGQTYSAKGGNTQAVTGEEQTGPEREPASTKGPWSDDPPPFTQVKPKQSEDTSLFLPHDEGTEETGSSDSPPSSSAQVADFPAMTSDQMSTKGGCRWWPFGR